MGDYRARVFHLSWLHFQSKRRDKFAQPFYDRLSDAPLVVTKVRVHPNAEIEIELTEGYKIRLYKKRKREKRRWIFSAKNTTFYLDEEELTCSIDVPSEDAASAAAAPQSASSPVPTPAPE